MPDLRMEIRITKANSYFVELKLFKIIIKCGFLAWILSFAFGGVPPSEYLLHSPKSRAIPTGYNEAKRLQIAAQSK